MQILRETHIDFMKYRKFWITVSFALVAVGIFSVFFEKDLNIGIDFAGGTQLTLKFQDRPKVEELRSLLASRGMGDAEIQSFGDEAENQIILRTRAEEKNEEGKRARIEAALDQRFNGAAAKPDRDLNRIGAEAIGAILLSADPDKVAAQGPDAAKAHYAGVAKAISDQRQKVKLFTGWDALSGVPGVSPAAIEALKQNASIGKFAILGVENVGPQVGRELRNQGYWAVGLSLLGMLIYIWFRFELRFGVGAVMACIHDVLVTLGIFALFRQEFNLTTVAAFLTLVGYSMCDTVVIFDRIRENMRKNRREPLIDVMNKSLNQTLARTFLTGGSVLVAVLALLIFGGPVIRGFAVVMTVGTLVGTYSSMYVASPFALLWEQYFGKEAKARRAGAANPAAGRA